MFITTLGWLMAYQQAAGTCNASSPLIGWPWYIDITHHIAPSSLYAGY